MTIMLNNVALYQQPGFRQNKAKIIGWVSVEKTQSSLKQTRKRGP